VVVAFFAFAPEKFNAAIDFSPYLYPLEPGSPDRWVLPRAVELWQNWPATVAFGMLVVALALVGLGKLFDTEDADEQA
jgi:hypothetical protein